MNTHSQVFRRERGAALIVALVLLLLMTVLGVTAMRTTTLQERMAGNLRDSNLAFQAAEAGLRGGEQLLEGAIPPFTGSNGLLQVQAGAGQATFWSSYDWAANSRTASAVAGVQADPQYVVEELPVSLSSANGSLVEGGSGVGEAGFYRITARAVGGSTDAIAILQTTYRRQ
ncbi:MAG TPA: pilus assembly protein [Gammaproteobacteria bacterium]|nr:pilus assembly protein [Gammaproteobacteria bacterium]